MPMRKIAAVESREGLMPRISAVHKFVVGNYRGLNARNKNLYK